MSFSSLYMKYLIFWKKAKLAGSVELDFCSRREISEQDLEENLVLEQNYQNLSELISFTYLSFG